MVERAQWGAPSKEIRAWCEAFYVQNGRLPTPSEAERGTGLPHSTVYSNVKSWQKQKEADLQTAKLASSQPDVSAISTLAATAEKALDQMLELMKTVRKTLAQVGKFKRAVTIMKHGIERDAKACERNLGEALIGAATTIAANHTQKEALEYEIAAVRDQVSRQALELNNAQAEVQRLQGESKFWEDHSSELQEKLNARRKPRIFIP